MGRGRRSAGQANRSRRGQERPADGAGIGGSPGKRTIRGEDERGQQRGREWRFGGQAAVRRQGWERTVNGPRSAIRQAGGRRR